MGMLAIDHLLKSTVILLSLIFFTSCLKVSEKITPLAEPKSLAQLQQEALLKNAAETAGSSAFSITSTSTIEMSSDPSIYYLNLTYNVQDVDVFQVANIPNTFEQLGHSFLLAAAKFVLAVMGPREVSLSDVNLIIPNMTIDRSIVKSVKIKRIFIQYSSAEEIASDYAANFAFVNTLELTMPITVPRVGNVDSLLFSYQKIHNRCMYKCIQFDVFTDNVLDIVTPNTTLKLKPYLSVGSIPAVTDLKLDGQIELQIGLKLPF